METTSRTKFSKITAVHPKVLEVLNDLKVPSPARVVSDKHQPKSGVLQKHSKNCKLGNYPEPNHSKKQVFLSLQRNSLVQRRCEKLLNN